MTILDYNRVLRDLNGLTADEVLRAIGRRYASSRRRARAPGARRRGGMVLGGRWYRLALKPEILAEAARAATRSRGCR